VVAPGDSDAPLAAAGVGPELAGGGAARTAFLALRFANEVWTVAVLAWAGASASTGAAGRIVLAVLGPVLFIAFWGPFMGPRSKRRLRHPVRMVAELIIFVVSGGLLALSGHVLGAVIYLVVAAGAALLSPVIAPEP
jgi:hypothetical protein